MPPDIMKEDHEMPYGWPPPWVPASILAGFCFLLALMRHFNWTPFW